MVRGNTIEMCASFRETVASVSPLLLYLQYIWLQTTFGHILRLDCISYGNFSIVKTGYRQSDHILTTLTFQTEDECENQCKKHRLCKSININNNNYICELNSKSTEDPFDNVQLTNAAGWSYKSTDYKEANIGYYCQEMKPCPIGLQCTDSCSYPGYQCQITSQGGFLSCQEAYNKGIRETGIVALHISGFNTTDVRCDMITDGGGWTLFQRRIDASVDFRREWDDYKTGFGDLNGNFWLGLENLHQLAAPGKGAKLRIDLKHVTSSTNYYAVYNTFEISNETDGYRLKIGGFSGNAGDSMEYHNGMKFSTKDRDNDKVIGSCAGYYEGAWWHKECFRSHLNGRHPSETQVHDYRNYMTWLTFKIEYGGWTMSEMKLK